MPKAAARWPSSARCCWRRRTTTPDEKVRKDSDEMLSLLTPITKAFLTDNGYNAATQCQQVFGGHGYIKEWGMEQFVRDARINMIYEGTNTIQSLDLLGRKVLATTAPR
jgi:alkylation response protein AidB-like acyl-CoA dehydrogenase